MTQMRKNPPEKPVPGTPPKLAAVRNRGARWRSSANGWLNSSLGQAVLTEENRLLERAVRRMHGDTLLWSGVNPGTATLSRRCMVRHRIYANPMAGSAPGHSVVADLNAHGDDMSCFSSRLEEIPLRNGCVDALVLHHTLELCQDPRAALREAARVLQPGGQLVVCTFNALGSFSWCRWQAQTPARFLLPARLKDWLDVLGFETVVAPEYAMSRPPFLLDAFESPRWEKTRAIVHRVARPLGNVVVLHVRKKNLSIRPDWQVAPRRRVALAGAGYPRLVDNNPRGKSSK